MWTASHVRSAMRAGRCIVVRVMRMFLRRASVQPAAHHSVSRMKRISGGCGSWCTTGNQGGTRLRRSTTLVSCTPIAKVSNKTTKRRFIGSERRQSMGLQGRSTTLVSCTPIAKVSNKTAKRRSIGTERRQSMGLQGRSTTLVPCTNEAKGSNTTTKRQSSGTERRREQGVAGARCNLGIMYAKGQATSLVPAFRIVNDVHLYSHSGRCQRPCRDCSNHFK